MALLFRAGPQVGAVRAPACRAGVTASVGPGAVPAAPIPIFSDQARQGRRIAIFASGSPAVADPISSDRGRFSA
jgi:hypothetical protein